ncbi:MAG: hypothetical protein AB1714_15245 [Acidobacteriota bacterium]
MASEKKDVTTGIVKDSDRWHFDIYAILEGAQELYFGDQVQINVNLVETVKLGKDKPDKCYLSPTKRRGVERRSLIWAPVKNGKLLGDKLNCGIPNTCADLECPICAVFGGLQPGKKTLVGRLVHGGGVAVQEMDPVEKQRAMHPSMISKEKGDDPIPFKRQYNEPGLLYPVYNHCLSVTDEEFTAVAYAFLDSLARLGAGNPKGLRIHEHQSRWVGEPLLVVDRYLAPLGKRPVVSPSLDETDEVIKQFADAAEQFTPSENFERRKGKEALKYLQECAAGFVKKHLTGS